MKAWLNDLVVAYVGNAQAVRDYRSQLRGNRPIFLWSAYLAVLILLTAAFLQGLENSGGSRMSVTQLQSQLGIFYQMVVGMLAGAVCIIAPALTASAITVERQRRSLDLLFSSPISIRYMLIGKLISSLRYILMLLVLALPILAICVVMGGATPGDVLKVTAILMTHAVVLSSIGLVMSAINQTIAASIVWTYIAVGGYLFFGMLIGLPSMGSFLGRTSFTGEAPWTVTLSPFGAAISAGTYTTLWGVQVPNWILLLLFSIALTRVFVSGAGSYLSSFGSRETVGLRIQSLVLGCLAFGLLTYPLSLTFRMVVVGASPVMPGFTNSDIFGAYIAAVAGMLLLLVAPAVSTYGYDEGRKTWPNGLFSFRHILDGTPAGAGPFLLMLFIACVTGGWGALALSGGGMPGPVSLSMCIWSIGILAASWALGRAASGPRQNSSKTARSAVIGGLLLIFFMPFAVFSFIGAITQSADVTAKLMEVYYLRPLEASRLITGFLYGLPMLALAVFFIFRSERSIQEHRPRFEAYHTPPPSENQS